VKIRNALLSIALSVGLLTPTAAQVQVSGSSPAEMLEAVTRLQLRETAGTLFENVVAMLQTRYVDQDFRTKELPALAARYRSQAQTAKTLHEERAVVHQLLSHIPASHLGLMSRYSHRAIMADLLGVAYPNFGFQAIGAGESLYAGMVLEGGPAARSGLLVGDRLVSIDGVPAAASPRLDWRTDDAYIGDERDPSVQHVIAKAGDRIELRVERRPGEFVNVSIGAEEYSALDAAQTSVRVIRADGQRVGYLHFWFVHISGVPDLLTQALKERLRDIDSLVIDLRGRGGSATEIPRIVTIVREYKERTSRPVVALVDRQSRSGKDILAHEFKAMGVRMVGEATAGAVIPASFGDVGFDSVLMFPTMRLPKYTDLLEFKPVQPDVEVTRPGLFAAGRDGILDAGVAEAVRLAKRR
jgi:C-terminal processing protease CtpA/Prc